VIIVAVLALTSVGHVVDAAVQHFMLYYAGVFALIALCGATGLGFVATDRMILSPGHRVFIQSAHRAVSFGALAFLLVHIVTEILAQRVHVLDAVIPFLSPFRTFYIGLGTIASDLIILLVITSIYRKRFTTNGNAWRWRAIHYSAYAAFVFGVWHGLLGGRPGKPYVDWSYGFVIAFVALGLGIRVVASSLRPKENLSSAPVSEAASSGSAPMRAAAMFAQLGIVRAASAGPMSAMMPGGGAGRRAALPAAGGRTGPMPAIAALSAPVMADAVMPDPLAGEPGIGPGTGRQPVYEAGYDGPPRFAGAPRNPGTGPMARAATGPMPRAASGPLPRAASGPLPRVPTGPMPRAATGPLPQATSGPYPVAGGPAGAGRDPQPRTASRPQTGPMRRPDTGPMARPQSGPLPQVPSGSFPAAGGPAPRPATGPMPRAATGAFPAAGGPPAWDPPSARRDGASPARPRPAATPPWDSGLPAGDPALRYREPGPGMPGYRGGDPRGGSPQGGDPYAADLHSADPYPAGWLPADEYAAGQYAAGQYAADHRPGDSYGAGQYPPGDYPGVPYATDPYGTSTQYSADPYPQGAQYPAAQYPADPRWDGWR
jgi:hypothetical protein